MFLPACLPPRSVRRLFYIEGSMMVLVAICVVFILPDFPATSFNWFTVESYTLAQLRMEEDVEVGNEEDFKVEELGLHLQLRARTSCRHSVPLSPLAHSVQHLDYVLVASSLCPPPLGCSQLLMSRSPIYHLGLI